jgi:L-aspartate oxidase
VQALLARGPQAVAWLLAQGVAFSTRDGGQGGVDGVAALHLTREGGHGRRRIAHAADATGHAICAALWARLRERPNIRVLEHVTAADLLQRPDGRCGGVWVLDEASGRWVALRASHTVLATGGLGQLYPHTTNPSSATGDGVAMAWRAGCRVANLEFIQFHPTSLCVQGAPSFLISEAVRGEGGLLRLPDGERFMPRHDARAELAPRDIVARAIAHEMTTRGLPHVLLDVSHRPPEFLAHHFPTIMARCRAHGIDITRQPMPVAPSAHYSCGGVLAGLDGATDLPGLRAVGETACTGLHGANRLASNSLLECVVMGLAAGHAIAAEGPVGIADAAPHAQAGSCAAAEGATAELRDLMWRHVGIVRCDDGLAQALARIEAWRADLADALAGGMPDAPTLAWRNLLDAAHLVVRSAQSRRESRGLHASLDWPQARPQATATVLAGLQAACPYPALAA